MTFTSIAFLFYFFPVTLGVYYLFGRSLKAQNIWLMVAGLLLYLWLEPWYFLILIFLIVFNYWAGHHLQKVQSQDKSGKRFTLAVCFIDAFTFVFFKLMAAYIKGGLPLFSLEYSVFADFALPVGLAFFSLRAISYIVDIYRRKYMAEKNIVNLALYISFFPQLVAGPLTTFRAFKPQLDMRPFDKGLFIDGARRFVIGLGKKVLLGTNLAVVSDFVFNLSSTSDTTTTVPVLLAWLGLLAFCLQIYFDLSGYADMAIGLGMMFGFRAPENFRYPYAASSLSDFWKRWTITLRDWFDEYIFRSFQSEDRGRNNDRVVLYTLIVFVLMGLWYEASIGMLIWAAVQVLFMTIEDVIDYKKRSYPRILKHIYTLFIVALSMALFRSGDYYQMLLFLRNLFGMSENGFFSPDAIMLIKEYGVFLLAGIVFATPIASVISKRLEAAKSKFIQVVSAIAYPLILVAVLMLVLMYISRGLYVAYPYFVF